MSKGRQLRQAALPALFALSSLLLGTGCTKQVGPYKSAMRAAEEARRDDRFEQERAHFATAAQHAKKPKDAGEARYRRAHSWVREGDYETGAEELERFAKAHPRAIRAARAWLDAGRAWERAGQPQQALGAFSILVERYPESGNAIAGAKRIVLLLEQEKGVAAPDTWRKLLEKNRSSVLDEALRYQYAKSLEATSTKQAILTYEDVARRHPLPHGTYTDEALLRAAELRRAQGDAQGALHTIELLLEQGGRAAFVGSYTRTAYVEGLMLRGKILRDDLERLDEAREAFQLLPKKYPHSRLVDDAYWENIVTSRRQGKDGCELMKKLRKASPQSRFLRCKPLVCSEPTAPEAEHLKCRRWLGEDSEAPSP